MAMELFDDPGGIKTIGCCCCPYVKLDCCSGTLPACLKLTVRGQTFNLVFSSGPPPLPYGWISGPGSVVQDNEDPATFYGFDFTLACFCPDDPDVDPNDPCFEYDKCAWFATFDFGDGLICQDCQAVENDPVPSCDDFMLTFTVPVDCGSPLDGETVTITRHRMQCCCCCGLGGKYLSMVMPTFAESDCSAEDPADKYAELGETDIRFDGPGPSYPEHSGTACTYQSCFSVEFSCYDNPLAPCTPLPPGGELPPHLLLRWLATFAPGNVSGQCKLTVHAIIQETECPVVGYPAPYAFITATYEIAITRKQCDGVEDADNWPITLPKTQDAGTEYVVFPSQIVMQLMDEGCANDSGQLGMLSFDAGLLLMGAVARIAAQRSVWECTNCGHQIDSAMNLAAATCPVCGK